MCWEKKTGNAAIFRLNFLSILCYKLCREISWKVALKIYHFHLSITWFIHRRLCNNKQLFFFLFYTENCIFDLYEFYFIADSNIDFTKLTTQFQFLTKKRSFTYEAYEVWTKLIAFDTSEQKISIATNNNTAELDHDFVLRAYNRLENTHISVQRWEFIE